MRSSWKGKTSRWFWFYTGKDSRGGMSSHHGAWPARCGTARGARPQPGAALGAGDTSPGRRRCSPCPPAPLAVPTLSHRLASQQSQPHTSSPHKNQDFPGRTSPALPAVRSPWNGKAMVPHPSRPSGQRRQLLHRSRATRGAGPCSGVSVPRPPALQPSPPWLLLSAG